MLLLQPPRPSSPKLLIFLIFYYYYHASFLATAITCYGLMSRDVSNPLPPSECLTILARLPDLPDPFDGDLATSEILDSQPIYSFQRNTAFPTSLPFLPRASFLHKRCKVDIQMSLLENSQDESSGENLAYLAWAAARARVGLIVEHCLTQRSFSGGEESVKLAMLGTQRVTWYINVVEVPESGSWPGWYGTALEKGKRALSGTPNHLERVFETTFYLV